MPVNILPTTTTQKSAIQWYRDSDHDAKLGTFQHVPSGVGHGDALPVGLRVVLHVNVYSVTVCVSVVTVGVPVSVPVTV